MPYIPHTESDVSTMLKEINVGEIEALFDEIPASLRCKPLTHIPNGLNELELNQLVNDKVQSIDPSHCYLGAGAYEHHIPACVWDIASRGEFLTAYTPYQAEASQGTLQLLYEFQTMMAKLTGMEVSNASLYDGASALAEAILMAVRANKRSNSKRILMIEGTHPYYIETVKTLVSSQNIELIFVSEEDLSDYDNDVFAAMVISYPTFLGSLLDVENMTDWAHQRNIMLIASVNPMSLALLKPPGEWGELGADIVCGEGQPLGVPLASGGPYFGFLTCKKIFVRQLPGRLVGRTVDLDGNEGFSLTLQAREQHIRRSKATSNICTNQGLLVTAATIYMSVMGHEGLKATARVCHSNMVFLLKALLTIEGIERVCNKPFFHEVAIKLPVNAEAVLAFMQSHGIEAGVSLAPYYPELSHCILVCVTETKTKLHLEQYALLMRQAIDEVK